jgi:hypothetical protein
VTIDLSNWNTPSTAIPKILKGMDISQKIGYKIIARIAKGQHKMNTNNQSKNDIIA